MCLTALFSTSCIDASNPCDPDAPDQERRTSTLSGVVKDQHGAPLSDITVLLTGHPTPAISDERGAFSFTELAPNDGPVGYEIVALPEAPRVGGRVMAPVLGCEEARDGVEVVVAVPPPSPEVEIVQATGSDRLFVAFAKATGGTRYRVEVRAPFESWQPAALAPFAAQEGGVAALRQSAPLATVTDAEAQSLCGAFSYVLPLLENENARCAEVLGVPAGETVQPLLEHGSYEVRVRAELSLDEDMVQSQRLPEVVQSGVTAVPGELALAPTSLLPVMLDPDEAQHEAIVASMDIEAIVPVANGRFAMLGSSAGVDGMMIVGDASATAPGEYDGSSAAPEGAMAYDAASPTAAAELSADEGKGLAILPAKRWVRVWKRFVDPVTSESRSAVEKVFIGGEQIDESHAEQPDPAFDFDLDSAGLESELRAFAWLTEPEGTIGGDGPYDPPDGYLLLLRTGFVLLEHERGLDPDGALLEVFASDLEDGYVDSAYGGTKNGDGNATTTGVCSQLGSGALGVDGIVGDRRTRVCLDLEGALNEKLDLRAAAILPVSEGVSDVEQTFHLLADAEGDRVLALRTAELLGHGSAVRDHISDVPVGVAPGAMLQTRLLDCEGGAHEPVVLVANRGSLDVSVLGVSGAGADARVVERLVTGAPGVPVRFLEDPDGPSCADPYAWLVIDDGRLLPLDLRATSFGLPRCGDAPCAVRGRDRAPKGAISRDAEGKARVVVGGRGMLGEVGYLRPSSASR